MQGHRARWTEEFPVPLEQVRQFIGNLCLMDCQRRSRLTPPILSNGLKDLPVLIGVDMVGEKQPRMNCAHGSRRKVVITEVTDITGNDKHGASRLSSSEHSNVLRIAIDESTCKTVVGDKFPVPSFTKR